MIKGSIKVLTGNIISYPFNIAKVFIIARALDPAIYGVFNLFTVILSYGLWCELGILSGMDKTIPFLRGKLNYEEVANVKNVAFTWFNIAYLALAVTLLVVSFFPFFSHSSEVNVGVRLLSVLVFTSALQNFYLTVLRADKKFGTIGITNAVLAVSSVLLLLLAYKSVFNKLYATLVALIMAYAISLLFCMLRSKLTFKINLSVSRLIRIIHTGFPLVIIGIGFTIFTSIDRWVIAKYLEKSQLGYYAFGVSISNLLFGMMSVFAYVIFPLIREKFGKDNDLLKFKLYIHKVMALMSYIVALTSCLLIASLPFMYKTFFYKYLAGIKSANFIIIGVFFISLATITGNFLVAVNKQRVIILAQAIGIILMLTGNYFVIKFTNNITGVAVVTAFLFSLYSIFIISCAFRYVGDGYLEIFKSIFRLFLPFILGGVIIILLKLLFNILNYSEFIMAFISALVITLIFAALFQAQYKGIFTTIKTLLNKKSEIVL